MFIRICGTHNTANEVFHCVHFECPCQPAVLQSYLNEENSTSISDNDGVKYDEFAKSLFEKDSFVQTYSILPFTIKPKSAAIFPIDEQESN